MEKCFLVSIDTKSNDVLVNFFFLTTTFKLKITNTAVSCLVLDIKIADLNLKNLNFLPNSMSSNEIKFKFK